MKIQINFNSGLNNLFSLDVIVSEEEFFGMLNKNFPERIFISAINEMKNKFKDNNIIKTITDITIVDIQSKMVICLDLNSIKIIKEKYL